MVAMTRPALAAAPSIHLVDMGAGTHAPAQASLRRTHPDQPSSTPDGGGLGIRQDRPITARALRDDAAGADPRPGLRTEQDDADEPTATTADPGRLARAGDAIYAYAVLLAPLVVAGWFQAHVAHGRLGLPWALAIGFTLAWEGAAGYTARLYVRALLRGDSTVMLRLAMMAYAGVSCGLLAWDLHMRARPWYLAAAVGALTMSGIFLWSRRARDLRRDVLHARGMVDAQLVRFSLAAWILCPLETPAALRYAIRHRLTNPIGAVEAYRSHRRRQALGKRLVVARQAARQHARDLAEIAARSAAHEADAQLLRVALVEAGRLLGSDQRITRDTLAAAIRGRGVSVSNQRAGQLARDLSSELTKEEHS